MSKRMTGTRRSAAATQDTGMTRTAQSTGGTRTTRTQSTGVTNTGENPNLPTCPEEEEFNVAVCTCVTITP